MKKRIIALAMAAVMAAGLVGCGGASSSKTTTAAATEAAKADGTTAAAADGSGAGKSYSIDVILKTTSSEYWSYVLAGAKAYSKDHPEVKVDVKGATSETAYDEQQNMIETDLNSGNYDAFVIAPLQSDMAANLISGQKKPIIAVDTNINAPEVLSFVGTSNEDAAKLGGQKAVEAAKVAGATEITAIAISGVQGDQTAGARLKGYQEGVEAAGGKFLSNETQYADGVADKAVTSMESIMQNHPEGISIIVCNNDDTAMGAAKAAAGNEAYKDTVFIGFDGIKSACQAIMDGKETMSVAQEAYDMGYKAVEAAVKALDGETLDKFMDSGCSVVDKSNAQERLDSLNKYLESVK